MVDLLRLPRELGSPNRGRGEDRQVRSVVGTVVESVSCRQGIRLGRLTGNFCIGLSETGMVGVTWWEMVPCRKKGSDKVIGGGKRIRSVS